MDKSFRFLFEGKLREAHIHISLQRDGSYIFTILKDEDLVKRFGPDVDFMTDCEKVVVNTSVSNPALHQLETAILEAAKHLPEFTTQKQQLQGIAF